MPSQPAPGDPLSHPFGTTPFGTTPLGGAPSFGTAPPFRSASPFPNVAIDVFTAREWELLVRLPGRVIVAATHTGRPGRSVREGLAGLEAMAAGRAFDSDLVRAVVAAVYAERLPGDPGRPAVDLLDECRDAVGVLRERADPADSAAYRQWVQSIAARVCTAGTGPAAGQLGPGDRRFLADLGHALGMV